MSEPAVDNESLVGHLTELRKRLIYTIIGVMVGFGVCWGFSEQIFNIIRQPIAPYLDQTNGGFIFTGPMDQFLAHIKVSFFTSIIITCPFWLYQLWRFIAPGLYKQEKKMGVVFIFSGSMLFLIGVSFVYFVVYPMAFEFLLNFGGSQDVAMITISEYLSFFTMTTLVFGLAFEMPLIFTILGLMGFISPEFLASKRRYAIVLLSALSAIVTPPDIISMGLMLLPMVLLYELSIVLVRVFGQKTANHLNDTNFE